MMTTKTATYLSKKYGVRRSIVERLARVSFAWQTSTEEQNRASLRRIYDRIVTRECGGIDPLV